jgi:hypothetical protein
MQPTQKVDAMQSCVLWQQTTTRISGGENEIGEVVNDKAAKVMALI